MIRTIGFLIFASVFLIVIVEGGRYRGGGERIRVWGTSDGERRGLGWPLLRRASPISIPLSEESRRRLPNDGLYLACKSVASVAAVKLRRRQAAPLPTAHIATEEPTAVELPRLADPWIDEATWESLTGREFMDHPELVKSLAEMGETVARGGDHHGELVWNAADSRKRQDNDATVVHAWTGTRRSSDDTPAYRGSQVPWVKTQAVVPGASPRELAELLMDSTRVKTYNPWSEGREDLWVQPTDDQNHRETKIVRNKTQPPFGKPLIATTLLHKKRLSDDAYLVVSRAVGGPVDDGTYGTSDILLGINLLEKRQGSANSDGTLLTAVTHVHSSAIPTMLAQRVGVKSAKQFVQDLRKAVAPQPVEADQ